MNGKVIGLLVLAIGIVVGVISPARSQNVGLKTELASLDNRFQATGERLQLLQETKDQVSKNPNEALIKVPRKREQAQLLRDIEFVSSRAGFSVLQMTFSERNEKEIGAKAVDVNVMIEGNRKQVSAFFRGIENNERLLEVKNYNMKLNGGESGVKATINATIRGYFQS